ncbi:MAG: ATP-binding cassette domain-containing protein [Acidimicrobiales bacterium]
MSSIVVSELDYAPPGGDSLFFDVSFGVAPGEHAALVGANGVGKSTILRILAGELEADAGETSIGGTVLSMTQDVGMARPTDTLRQLLIEVAPPALRRAGRALVAAEAALADGSDDGMAYATALTEWGDLGGYELEAQWAAAARRSVKTPVDDVGTRLVGELSGGERKRLVLDLLLTSGADVLLLDEPDNYLDIPTRRWLEDQLRACRSTILLVSHDRALLEAVATKIVVIEGAGCWVHGGGYGSFPEARARRQEQLGDALKRWNDEERRLFNHMKIMKARAAQNFKNATKANAAETRWERFVAAGPPPPPVPDQQIHVRLRGADAARRVLRIERLAVGELFLPFSDEVFFGERVGLIGPSSTGKSHLMAALAGEHAPRRGYRPVWSALVGGAVHPDQRPARLLGPHAVRDRPPTHPGGRAGHAGAGPLRLGRQRPPTVRDVVGRAEGAPGDPLPRAGRPQPAAARRAHRQPRRRVLRGARTGPRRVRGCGGGGEPRSGVPGPARPLRAHHRRR